MRELYTGNALSASTTLRLATLREALMGKRSEKADVVKGSSGRRRFGSALLLDAGTALEGGLRQVDASEGAEFIRWLRALLFNCDPDEVDRWINSTPKGDRETAGDVLAALRAGAEVSE